MARAIERIEKDIKALEETASGIASSLQESYTNYFAVLGKAVRQQLILATYHLCTQGYPQVFLRLSLNQRQKLQQSIRNLGTQTAEQIAKYAQLEAEPPTHQNTTEEKPLDVKEVEAQEVDNKTSEKETDNKENQLETSSEAIPLSFIELLTSEASPFNMEDIEDMEDMEDMEEIDIEDMEDMEEIDMEDIQEIDEFVDENTNDASSKESKPQTEKKSDAKKAIPRLPKIPIFPLINPIPLRFSDIKTSNPMEISKWVQSLEISTQFALKKLSREANQLLQKSEILPKKLPEPVLEAAATVSEAADVMPGPPNILSVVVEVENEQKKGDSGLTQVMAVNLRLAEIEFGDSQVSGARNQLRNFHGQLQKLRREYIKKQRELAIAEAEAAWRASWFDDL
jgi:hypothetical protein